MSVERIEVKAQFTVAEDGTIEGVAWPFGSADRVGDIIEPAAFAQARAPLPMFAEHDPAATVGVWDAIAATAEGLTVKGRLLSGEVARAREMRALVREKAVTGLSIGFRTLKSAPRRGGGRTISALDLMEISLVAVPAHPGARITSAKAGPAATKESTMDDQQAPDTAALETQLGQLADTVKGLAPLADSVKALQPLAARLDKLEARLNRPTGGGDQKAEPTAEKKAFGTYLRLGNAAPAEELKALNVSSDAQGGYLAPAEFSTEFLRDLVEFSPIRAIASVRNTGAPSVLYPKRVGITNAAWRGEMQPQTGSEPSFGQTEVVVKELATYVDISNQLLADSAGQADTEVRLALAEDFGQKEGAAFLKGDGVLAPEGLLTATGVASTQTSLAADWGVAGLLPLKLQDVKYSLPAAYRNRAVWLMNGTTLAAIQKIRDADGRGLWQPSLAAGQPETLLGRPVIEIPDMDDPGEFGTAIVFGDISTAYRIVDRVGLSILVNPYLRATEGITRIHATRRVGARVVQPAALRKITVTA